MKSGIHYNWKHGYLECWRLCRQCCQRLLRQPSSPPLPCWRLSGTHSAWNHPTPLGTSWSFAATFHLKPTRCIPNVIKYYTKYSKISVHQPDQNTKFQLCYALNYRTVKVNKIYPRIKALTCQFILECRLLSNSPEHRVKVPFQQLIYSSRIIFTFPTTVLSTTTNHRATYYSKLYIQSSILVHNEWVELCKPRHGEFRKTCENVKGILYKGCLITIPPPTMTFKWLTVVKQPLALGQFKVLTFWRSLEFFLLTTKNGS